MANLLGERTRSAVARRRRDHLSSACALREVIISVSVYIRACVIVRLIGFQAVIYVAARAMLLLLVVVASVCVFFLYETEGERARETAPIVANGYTHRADA